MKEDEFNLDSLFSNPACKILEREKTNITHEIYLGDSIVQDTLKYADLVHFLKGVAEDEMVVFNMIGYGGDCMAGSLIVNAIKTCAAPVLMEVRGECYSMHSIIALAGTYLFMHEGSMLMFHNYTGSTSGKGAELETSFHNQDKLYKGIVERVCYPFLSREELAKVFKDQDIYIHADDKTLSGRIKRHFKNGGIKK